MSAMRRETLSFLVAAFTLVGLLLSGCFGGAKSTSNETGVAFATPQSFAVGVGPTGVGSADFNNDGLPDLVVANTGTNTVSVLLNSTTTAESPSPSASTSASPTATATPSPSPSASPSPATVTFSQTFDYTAGSGPMSVAISDINSDGRPDIVIGNTDGTMGVLINTTTTGSSNPTFSQVFLFPTTGRSQQTWVTVADVNGDGRPDVITTNNLTNTIGIFLNTTISNTEPKFTGPYQFATGTGPGEVAALDINSDGFIDYVTANTDGTVTVLLGSTVTSSVVPNPSPPTLAYTYSLQVGNGALYGLVLADFNKDGLTDIAVSTGNGNAAVLRNTTNQSTSGSPTPSPSPSASVDLASTNPSIDLSFAQAMIFGLNGTPASLAGGSFAVGGANDLVSAITGNNNVSVLVNQSSGTTMSFADGERWNAGTSPTFVLPVDIDGDGMTDLVVPDRGSNQVSVLINVSTAPTSGVSSSPAASVSTTTGSSTSTTSSTSTSTSSF